MEGPGNSGDLGVLLTDMGSPASPADLEAFLRALLGDPRILRVPMGGLVRPLLARHIARTRARKVAARYEAIGGGSPLLRGTRRLAAAVEAVAHLPVGVAMRYTEPRLTAALEDLRCRAVRRMVLIPLYPQYSTSTTASTLDDLDRYRPLDMEIAVVERHADHAAWLNVMAGLLGEALVSTPTETRVLFTAHSIPERFTRDGDPYVSEIEAAVAGISALAGLALGRWSLAYQSTGPVGRWHGPSWEEEVDRLHGEGIRTLVVQPLSFVSENLETLWDLDIVMRKRCEDLGIAFTRVPTPGASPGYAALLAGLAIDTARKEAWIP